MSASAQEIDAAASARRESGSPLSDRQRARLVEALEAARSFYLSRRTSSWVPEYLATRRLEIPDAGYAPGGGSTLRKALLSEGFTDDELTSAGLVKPSERGDSLVDHFKARLMLPVLDASGDLVGFVGRRRDGARGPKYLNSPASALYDKSSTLMGLAEGADALRAGAVAVFVEGPLDAYAVTSASAGVAVGLAAGGTTLGPGHLGALGEIIDLGAHRFAYATDDDDAGRKAAVRGWELLAEAGTAPELVRRPELDGHDPAKLMEIEGPAALSAAVTDETSPLLIDTYADTILSRWDTDNALQLVDALRSVARHLSDHVTDTDAVTEAMARLAARHEAIDALMATEALADVLAGIAAPAAEPTTPSSAESSALGTVANLDDYRGGRGGDDGGSSGGGGDIPPRPERVFIYARYGATDEGLYKVKFNAKKNQEEWVNVLPVRVRVVGKYAEDLGDGSDVVTTHYDLVATRQGEEHVLHNVDIQRWDSCSWVRDLPWSVRDVPVGQGRRELRDAILDTSEDVPRTTMYGSLGWQKIGGRWVYVHAGGGIDASGSVPDLRVNVPPPLQRFELPDAPVTVEGLRAAVLASTALMDVAPARIAAPLLGSAYRACLGWSRATVMPFGPKGAGKTGVAAATAQHYAPSARYDDLPGPGAGDETGGTGFALEELRYRAGDLLLPLDDLAPDKGTERASQRCALIARSQYNRQAKMRGQRDGGLRPSHLPRSLPLVTGEETTTVESAESRIVTLRVSRGDVSAADLKLLDSGEEPLNRARLTASMIRHYAPAKDSLDDWLRETREELSEELISPHSPDLTGESRQAGLVADLAAGWRAMLDMAVRRQALTEAEAEELWSRAWAGLAECKSHLMAGVARRTPADRTRELLRTLLVQRRVSLRAEDGESAPEDVASMCGWELELAYKAGADGYGAWRERGDCIGWTDGTKVWLIPGATHDALTTQARREEDPLTYTGRGLGEALADCGVIRVEETKDGGRRTSVRAPRIGIGKAATRPRVWEVEWSWLFADDEDDNDGDAAAPPAAPTAPAPVDVDGPASENPTTGQESPATYAELDRPAEPTPADTATDRRTAPHVEASPDRRAERVASMEIDPTEIREAQKWAADRELELSEEQATAAVERFHQATACRWWGPHGSIQALLSGRKKWSGVKTPEPADLGLFTELLESDQFWRARSWVITPGDPAEGSSIIAPDVNAQYNAAANSVDVGIGDPVHYEPGDELPKNVFKMPGWVRLASEVASAPNGLSLPEAMWVPTPLAVYLTRDHDLSVNVSEALVWHEKRPALKGLSGHFKKSLTSLKSDDSEPARTATAMVKSLYTKLFGGYMAAKDEGLVPPEWHRPDWAMQLRAVAETNQLRGLDRLPAGCVPRAKFADAAFIEIPPEQVNAWEAAAAAMRDDAWSENHVKAVGWVKLDPVQQGHWKLPSCPVPAETFRGLKDPTAWRTAYESAQQDEALQ